MKYRVLWDPDAVDTLQHVYNSFDDQEGLMHAVTRVGLEPAYRPAEAGESRDGVQRILFKHPLIVWFRIDEANQEVVVQEVRVMHR